jgi:adenine specific DNA methylase Mod
MLYMRENLAEDGSLYVHLDWKMSHYVKIVVDEIFGKNNFRNEIIWQKIRVVKAQSLSFGNVHDNILMYSKNLNNIFNTQHKEQDDDYDKKFDKLEKETGRRYQLVSLIQKGSGHRRKFVDKIIEPPAGMHWIWAQERIDKAIKNNLIEFTSTGNPRKKQYLDDSKGKFADDLWIDIFPINSQAKEFVGYPTQKPEALLERIILASSNPGDLVMDVFGGSGTTAAVAEKLGRRWIVCDFGKHAIYTMQKRMLKIAESKALGKDVKKKQKYGKPPKPFCVVSTGAYDFSRIMKLRENKDADEKDLSGKYRLTNIFGEKDGDPVEVYPVWNDGYLKNIRIDEKYLKGIIVQSRSKLKGNYYIITPETCTLVGDTTMKNSAGNDVHFKMLKFPYKILEDVSRF